MSPLFSQKKKMEEKDVTNRKYKITFINII